MTDRNAFMYDSSGKIKPEYDLNNLGMPATSVDQAQLRRITAGSPLPAKWPPVPPHQPVQPVPVVAESLAPFPIYQPSVEKEGVPAYKFLEDGAKVMKQRAELRDKPEGERSMEAIVRTFNALTGKNLSESEGWEFMILLKMVRGRQGKFNEDDYTDMAAYSGLLGECESTSRK